MSNEKIDGPKEGLPESEQRSFTLFRRERMLGDNAIEINIMGKSEPGLGKIDYNASERTLSINLEPSDVIRAFFAARNLFAKSEKTGAIIDPETAYQAFIIKMKLIAEIDDEKLRDTKTAQVMKDVIEQLTAAFNIPQSEALSLIYRRLEQDFPQIMSKPAKPATREGTEDVKIISIARNVFEQNFIQRSLTPGQEFVRNFERVFSELVSELRRSIAGSSVSERESLRFEAWKKYTIEVVRLSGLHMRNVAQLTLDVFKTAKRSGINVDDLGNVMGSLH